MCRLRVWSRSGAAGVSGRRRLQLGVQPPAATLTSDQMTAIIQVIDMLQIIMVSCSRTRWAIKTEKTVWTMCLQTWVAEICQCEVLNEKTCEGVRKRGTVYFFLFVQSAHVSVSEHANVTQRASCIGRVIYMSRSERFSLLLMCKREFLTFGSRFDHTMFNFRQI